MCLICYSYSPKSACVLFLLLLGITIIVLYLQDINREGFLLFIYAQMVAASNLFIRKYSTWPLGPWWQRTRPVARRKKDRKCIASSAQRDNSAAFATPGLVTQPRHTAQLTRWTTPQRALGGRVRHFTMVTSTSTWRSRSTWNRWENICHKLQNKKCDAKMGPTNFCQTNPWPLSPWLFTYKGYKYFDFHNEKKVHCYRYFFSSPEPPRT